MQIVVMMGMRGLSEKRYDDHGDYVLLDANRANTLDSPSN